MTVLPQYLLNSPGVLQEDFENASDWIKGGSAAGTITADTTNVRTGTQSVKLTLAASGNVTADKVIAWDLSASHSCMRISVYCHNLNMTSFIIYLSSVSNFSRFFTCTLTQMHLGWNTYTLIPTDWSNSGGESWSNTMVRMRLRVDGDNTETLSFDSLYAGVDSEPVVLLTFDDGFVSHYSQVFAYAEPLGIRGTAYVIGNNIGGSGSMTEAQLVEMDAAGWDIGNHTDADVNLEATTAALGQQAIEDCKTILDGMGLTRASEHLAYVQGAYGNSTDAVSGKVTAANAGMLTARTTVQGREYAIVPAEPDWYEIRKVYSVVAATSLATVEAWIDDAIARGEVLILNLHNIVTSPTANQWSITNLQGMMDHIASSGITSITISQYYALASGPVDTDGGGGDVIIDVAAGALGLAGQSADVQPGAVALSADAGALALAGQPAAVVPGAVSVAVDAATLTISGQTADATAAATGDLTEGLISYWSLDEASGTRNDSHGANHLTDNATVASTTGKVATAADFEAGNSEYLSRASNADLQTGDIDFTFAVWVNLESAAGSRTILSKFSNTGNLREYLLDYNATTSRFRFTVSSNGTLNTVLSANSHGAQSNGAWAYVVVAHDSTNNIIAIQVNNGAVDFVAHSGGVFAGNAEFRIGAAVANGGAPAYFDGLIDEVGFWKRLLTDDERTDLYNGGSGRDYAYILSTSTPDPVTIDAAVGSITLAGQALESVSGSVTIAVASGALSLSGQAADASALLTIYADASTADGSGNTGLSTGDPVSLADAVDLCVPGTTVLLMDGTYELSSSLAITLQGTADAWITFQPQTPGGAFIEWTGVTNDPMFYLLSATGEHCCFIEINGLIFDGANTATNGIFCQKPSGVTGFHPFAIRIINNEIRNTGSAGIATIQADYIHVIGNKIHHVGMVRGWGSGIALNTNIWADESPTFHNLILNNIISGVYDCCGTNRIDDPGDDTDITDGNGIIYDRSASGNISPPVLIANNVIYQNGGRGILTFMAGNAWIINNTCYQNGLDLLLGNDGSGIPDIGDIQIGGTSGNNYVFNNIVHAWTVRHAFALMPSSDAIWRSNLWFGGDDLYGIDPGDVADPDQFINDDPEFVNPPAVDPDDGGQYLLAGDPDDLTNEFYLRSGSPAIDYGIDPRTVTGQVIVLPDTSEVTDMTAIFAVMTEFLLTDAAGEPRDPGGDDWNLGAYELVVVVDTVAVNAGTLTLSGQAATVVPGAVTINADAGALAVSGQTADVQPGAVTVAVDVGELALSGQAAALQVGAVINAAAGALSLAGQQADIVPGAVTVQAAAAELTLTSNQASVQIGAVTINVATATLTLAGQDATAMGGAVSVQVQSGTLALTGQTVDIQPGAVSVSVDAGVLGITGNPATIGALAPAVTINATAGVLSLAGQQIDIVPGAVLVTVVAATLMMVGRPATTTAGETRGDWTVADAKAYEWTMVEAKAYTWTLMDSSR